MNVKPTHYGLVSPVVSTRTDHCSLPAPMSKSRKGGVPVESTTGPCSRFASSRVRATCSQSGGLRCPLINLASDHPVVAPQPAPQWSWPSGRRIRSRGGRCVHEPTGSRIHGDSIAPPAAPRGRHSSLAATWPREIRSPWWISSCDLSEAMPPTTDKTRNPRWLARRDDESAKPPSEHNA